MERVGGGGERLWRRERGSVGTAHGSRQRRGSGSAAASLEGVFFDATCDLTEAVCVWFWRIIGLSE